MLQIDAFIWMRNTMATLFTQIIGQNKFSGENPISNFIHDAAMLLFIKVERAVLNYLFPYQTLVLTGFS